MEEKISPPLISKEHSASQHEDAVLKASMQFFAEELLPYLGISGKVTAIAPTELIHLEIQKLYQDFDLFMEDGTIKHFEFQSTNPGLPGLKRFRTYEALTSAHHQKPVTTYVLYSGTIRNPMTEFTEGVNTYRVIPIIMRNKSADKLFQDLFQKLKEQIPLTKQDLIPLPLSLLMDGQMSLKSRVKSAYEITGSVTPETISTDDLHKIEALIYTMADKFLESVDLQEIMEGISMTRLGQMLVDKGIEQGLSEGRSQGLLEAARKLLPILDEDVIAKTIGLPLEVVQELKKEESPAK